MRVGCAQGCTDTHLISQNVMFVLQNVQLFFPLLKLSIMGNYGHAALSSEENAEKERWYSDSTRDSRPEIARHLQSVFLSAACSKP